MASASAWEYIFGEAVGCTVIVGVSVGVGVGVGCWLTHPLNNIIIARDNPRKTIHFLSKSISSFKENT
jgi:hypothetical protein